ncbi:MAG: hypothetical protein COA58_16565 [Bacteroidetes bacterium]|nr:MAG: hypothetical protein COA58_16565 [Bacteroidota bacterium]
MHLASILRYLLPKTFTAITLWPFIIFKYKENKSDVVLINHERIHLKQQVELLVIPFYIIYILEYLFLLVKLKDHNQAYLHISFEKEAYLHQDNLNYLSTRKRWATWKNN